VNKKGIKMNIIERLNCMIGKHKFGKSIIFYPDGKKITKNLINFTISKKCVKCRKIEYNIFSIYFKEE